MRSRGPLRAFGQRVRSRRGSKIATVAVGRKLLCLTWQLLTKEQDYLYERHTLTFRRNVPFVECQAGPGLSFSSQLTSSVGHCIGRSPSDNSDRARRPRSSSEPCVRGDELA